MGSDSSSCGTAADMMYSHQTYTNTDKSGYVTIRKRKVTGGCGTVHHFIAVNFIDDKWRVYEWMDDSKVHAYATKRVYGRHCRNLGWHKLEEVYRAAFSAAKGRRYVHFTLGSDRFNCNDWCEHVAYKLGYNVCCSAMCTR